jgi:single-stranded DNA-binding protein
MFINKVILVGELQETPRLESDFNTKTYLQVLTQNQQQTTVLRVLVEGRLASNCAQYLYQGRFVYIEGMLSQTSAGNSIELIAKNVVFLGERVPSKEVMPSNGSIECDDEPDHDDGWGTSTYAKSVEKDFWARLYDNVGLKDQGDIDAFMDCL